MYMRIGHTNTISEYSDVYGEYSDVYVTNSTIMGPDSDDDVHPVITGVSSNIHDASPNWRIEKSTTMGPDSDDDVHLVITGVSSRIGSGGLGAG